MTQPTNNLPAARPRKTLTQIAAVTWEHPADRAALQSLRSIPGFDLAAATKQKGVSLSTTIIGEWYLAYGWIAVIFVGARQVQSGLAALLPPAESASPEAQPAEGDGIGGPEPRGGFGTLALVSLPLLVLCFVPALTSRLLDPALQPFALTRAGELVDTIAVGPSGPEMLLALLGPALGVYALLNFFG